MDYNSSFIRFANSYVRDIAIAEDIVTDAFMSYWEHKSDISSESNIPAYILTTVKNKCLNYLKHRDLKLRTLNEIQEHAFWELGLRISTLEVCNPEELFSTEVQEIIDKTLKDLPEKTYEVFVQSRYKNKSHKEIADFLQITTKGVEFHITKALSKLRENLKDYVLTIILLFFL